MKQRGIIVGVNKDSARSFGEYNFKDNVIKSNKDEIETDDCIYKFYAGVNSIRGRMGISKAFIQQEVPFGVYSEVVAPLLADDATIQAFQ